MGTFYEFTCRIAVDGTETLHDPWILFWQMYRDVEAELVPDERE